MGGRGVCASCEHTHKDTHTPAAALRWFHLWLDCLRLIWLCRLGGTDNTRHPT